MRRREEWRERDVREEGPAGGMYCVVDWSVCVGSGGESRVKLARGKLSMMQ